MAMRSKGADFRVDTSKFHLMTKELASAASAEWREVLDFEVGRVISTAFMRTVGGTPRSRKETVRKIEHTNRRQKWIRVSKDSPARNLNAAPIPNRNGKPRAKPGTGIFYLPATWQKVLAENESRIKRKLAAVGTAAAQWLATADALGIKIEGRGLARSVSALRKFVKPQNAAGSRKVSSLGRYAYRIRNGSVLRRWAKMYGALQSAVNGRVGYFRHNFRSGVFRAADQIARKYPGIRVRGSDSRQIAA
jgi:hypothetical protein